MAVGSSRVSVDISVNFEGQKMTLANYTHAMLLFQRFHKLTARTSNAGNLSPKRDHPLTPCVQRSQFYVWPIPITPE